MPFPVLVEQQSLCLFSLDLADVTPLPLFPRFRTHALFLATPLVSFDTMVYPSRLCLRAVLAPTLCHISNPYPCLRLADSTVLHHCNSSYISRASRRHDLFDMFVRSARNGRAPRSRGEPRTPSKTILKYLGRVILLNPRV